MKKLILILSLLPFISFSQVLLDKVDYVCFSHKTDKEYDCYEADSTYSIELVDNDHFVIKGGGEITNHKITNFFVNKITLKEDKDLFEIDFNGETYTIILHETNELKRVLIFNDSETLKYTYIKKREQ